MRKLLTAMGGAAIILLNLGCTPSESETRFFFDSLLPAPPPEPLCPQLASRVLRANQWPGNGVQLWVSPGAGENILDASLGEKWQTQWVDAPVQTGVTGIIVIPSADEDVHSQRLEQAITLVQELGTSEPIAIWVAGEALSPVADLTTRQAHLVERIAQIPAIHGALTPSALHVVLAQINGLFSHWERPWRSVVVVGGSLPDVTPAAVELLSLNSAAQQAEASSSKPAGQHFQASEEVAAHISEVRANGKLLAACSIGKSPPASVTLSLGGKECSLNVAPLGSDWASAPCDLEAVSQDDFPLGNEISLEVAPADGDKFESYVENRQEDDFDVIVQLGEGPAQKAVAHLRGSGSLRCDRKSYNINLKGEAARRLGSEFADDEFFLLSLCLDDHYFRQILAGKMMKARGLFPLASRLLRLRVNGEAAGLYLMVEKPNEAIKRHSIGATALIRRRSEAGSRPEVKFLKEGEQADEALNRYNNLSTLQDELTASDLATELRARFDLDNYLQWLALNTYLKNGDTVDEAFFYAVNENGNWYWRSHGWDTDDLFSNCHFDGVNAYQDPNELAYCSEARLDRSVYATPSLYADYVNTLERIMNTESPPTVVKTHLGKVQKAMFALLIDEEVCSAMTEIGAANCQALRMAISGSMSEFLNLLEERHEQLQASIETYREGLR